MKALRFIPVAVLAIVTSNLASAASFDCHQARRPDERAICASRELSEMDVEMSVRYEMLIGLVAMGTRGNMQEEQHEWLQQRERCGPDQACLAHAYSARITTLKNEYDNLKRRGPF